MSARGVVVLTAFVVGSMATHASAEWAVTPYLAANVAGDAEFRRGGLGGSVGYFRDTLGFEVDLMRYNHFFKDANVDLVPNNCRPGVARDVPCTDLNTDALGVTGNVVARFRGPQAKWRPYGTVGLGVIHPWVSGPGDQYDLDQTDLAFNVGGGVTRSLKSRLALRADLRWSQAFVDKSRSDGAYFEDYGFLRLSVGLSFRFRRQ
jgi:opacity protein-like surface antigen